MGVLAVDPFITLDGVYQAPGGHHTADLSDRLNGYVFPIVLGTGKRLFDGTVPAAFRRAEPPVAFPKGAVSLVYERAGLPVTGHRGAP